jgi:hypothetical protein
MFLLLTDVLLTQYKSSETMHTMPPPATMPEVEAIRSILKESEAVLEKLEKKEAGARKELSKRAKELHNKEFKLPY